MSAQGRPHRGSRWRRVITLTLAGLVCLVVGGFAVAWAVAAYLGAALDETENPQIADTWWMAFVLWGGAVVTIGGPLLFWIVVPALQRLRRDRQSNG